MSNSQVKKTNITGHFAILIFMKIRAVIKISTASAGAVMPFPKASLPPPHVPEYAAVMTEAQAFALGTAVNRLGDQFNLSNRYPVRAAAVVYLGLCRLKYFSDTKQQDAGSTICRTLLTEYNPTNWGEKTVNCSFFTKDSTQKFTDHEVGIDRAGGIYLPRVKSRKKRCLVLLALGAQHTDQIPLPPSDDWISTTYF
jgi:hypothetical protein